MEEVQARKSIAPAIVLGIFVAIFIALAVFLILFDPNAAIKELEANNQNAADGSKDPVATSIALGFVTAFGVIGIIFFFFALATPLFVGSIICIIFSARGLRRNVGGLKVTYTIYTILLAAFIVFPVVKVILFLANQ